jgi:hypothetical protein
LPVLVVTWKDIDAIGTLMGDHPKPGDVDHAQFELAMRSIISSFLKRKTRQHNGSANDMVLS